MSAGARPAYNSIARPGRLRLANGAPRADAEGRFEINLPIGGTFSLRVVHPAGEPYFGVRSWDDGHRRADDETWPAEAIRLIWDIRLPRRVVLRGRVAERGMGRPLPPGIGPFSPRAATRRDSLGPTGGRPSATPPCDNSPPPSERRIARDADAGPFVDVQSSLYGDTTVAEAEGRVTFLLLIPGATYRFGEPAGIEGGTPGMQVCKEFRVGPAESLDLGDIPVGKPNRPARDRRRFPS